MGRRGRPTWWRDGRASWARNRPRDCRRGTRASTNCVTPRGNNAGRTTNPSTASCHSSITSTSASGGPTKSSAHEGGGAVPPSSSRRGRCTRRVCVRSRRHRLTVVGTRRTPVRRLPPCRRSAGCARCLACRCSTLRGARCYEPLRDPLSHSGRQEARDASAPHRAVRRHAERRREDLPLRCVHFFRGHGTAQGIARAGSRAARAASVGSSSDPPCRTSERWATRTSSGVATCGGRRTSSAEEPFLRGPAGRASGC